MEGLAKTMPAFKSFSTRSNTSPSVGSGSDRSRQKTSAKGANRRPDANPVTNASSEEATRESLTGFGTVTAAHHERVEDKVKSQAKRSDQLHSDFKSSRASVHAEVDNVKNELDQINHCADPRNAEAAVRGLTDLKKQVEELKSTSQASPSGFLPASCSRFPNPVEISRRQAMGNLGWDAPAELVRTRAVEVLEACGVRATSYTGQALPKDFFATPGPEIPEIRKNPMFNKNLDFIV